MLFVGDFFLCFDGYLNLVEIKKKIVYDVFCKGDVVFFFGDLVVWDEFGYIYFYDCIGDMFWWCGENVLMVEVELVMSKVVGFCDVVVYGVVVLGIEGWVGMVVIVDFECKVDFMELVVSLKKFFLSYVCFMFFRIVYSVDLMGIFKF